MASQAQIDANRKNASRSTGPKSEAGKARSRLNGLKDGTHARTVSRVLPQEKAGELDEHINKWLSDFKPRNDAERDLVIQAAKLLWERERARRCGTARLATRVCRAQLSNSQGRLTEVGELARRLLYNAGPKTLPTESRPWEDNPAACLSGLEKSAEGCRWLLDRWIGLRVLLDRKSEWTYGDMFCLIRLLGKYPIEAINDPRLNAIFLAWDAMMPGRGERFWKECKQCKPPQDPGFSDFGRWREIADRPADAAAAVTFLEQLVDEQVARLEELLQLQEELADDEAADRADRVSSDSSARGDRLRREQTAIGRELRQTLELLLKMRKAQNEEQSDENRGNTKEDECVETETIRRTGGARRDSSDGKRDDGLAMKQAPKKRVKDKFGSASALKMVMSERLDEQGFEKFFADPPAALVVLKGLRTLAEREVLPGCDPVQGGAASLNSMSDLGSKNAQVEANGDETEDDEQQEAMAHTPDSDGENRTQFRDEDSCGRGLDSTVRRHANESFAAVDVQPEPGPRWRPREET